MKEIRSREEVFELVSSFYAKVRKHERLGPIFNKAIDDWDTHIERLTDFWETNFFFTRNYKGNPMKVHAEVDRNEGYAISQVHFGNWLELWFSTIDERFVGRNAQLAKERARSMAHLIFMKLFSLKPTVAQESQAN